MTPELAFRNENLQEIYPLPARFNVVACYYQIKEEKVFVEICWYMGKFREVEYYKRGWDDDRNRLRPVIIDNFVFSFRSVVFVDDDLSDPTDVSNFLGYYKTDINEKELYEYHQLELKSYFKKEIERYIKNHKEWIKKQKENKDG